MRHSRRPGAKWFPYRAVRRYCPHCGVELRLVPRPCGHVLHLLMGAGIIILAPNIVTVEFFNLTYGDVNDDEEANQ